VETFAETREMEAFLSLIKSARAIFVVPELLRGGFILGASGGTGVVFVRDPRAETWNGPSFYTLGGVSFGLQAGGQVSEVIALIMTARGVSAFLNDSIRLGADVGVAVGPFGIGASAATQNLSADVLVFAKSKGLYGGLSLDGALVKVREDLNEAFYGSPVQPRDVLLSGKMRREEAQGLMKLLSDLARER